MNSRYDDLIPNKKLFENQFLITKTAPVDSNYVECLSISKWNIFLYSHVKHIKLIDLSGTLIGIFIGTLIDYNACKVIEEDLTIDFDLKDEDAMESLIYGFGGSFLFVCCDGVHERVFLDAGGSKSLVFDPEKQQAASTTGLILNDNEYRNRFDSELFNHLDINRDCCWFPAKLTAHHGVKRLLCNHFLDLKTWRSSRHWPKYIGVAKSTRDHAVRIAEVVQGSVKAMVNSGETICALTGGNETRFLLSACRPMVEELNYFTINHSGLARDVYLSNKIAQEFKLKYRLLQPISATNEEQISWQYAASHCVGGSNMIYYPTMRQTKGFKYHVGGVGGEIGRAFFWRLSDTCDMQLSSKDIVHCFGMPVHDRVTDAVSEWLESVDGFDPLIQLDLAYMELKVSAWAFAQTYAATEKNQIHPLLCRETCQLMLELTEAAKRESAYIKEGINAQWPELNKFPVNKYGDYRDVLDMIRILSNPKRILRKLRKTFN